MSDQHPTPRTVSRRRLFALGGSAAAAGAVTTSLTRPERAPAAAAVPESSAPVPFHGLHQAGIATPAQSHLLLTAYDVTHDAGRGQLAQVLQRWTTAARALTTGALYSRDLDIARDAGASALTVTVGIGGALLDRLSLPRPPALADLPAFAGDRLDPSRCDGDLIVQLCADDPLVLAHADRVLRGAGAPALTVRWQDTGFRGAAARRDGRTTRNLMGQLDGSNNLTTGQQTRGGPVRVDTPSPAWLTGGSYLVVRRVRMLLDQWEATAVGRQEHVIGRHKASGAPLGASRETDPVDLQATNPDGSPRIPADSHVRLATPGSGEQLLRRSYSYRNGLLPDATTDQGLLIPSYQKDPTTSFVPVQQRLAAHDALNAFTLTTGSALFAVLPGVRDTTDWLARDLLT